MASPEQSGLAIVSVFAQAASIKPSVFSQSLSRVTIAVLSFFKIDLNLSPVIADQKEALLCSVDLQAQS